jgi:hypothetical protein
MGWTNTLGSFWNAFMLAYAIFVIWSFARWILALGKLRFTLRDWLGSLGLAAGICSAALFAVFLIFLWMERELIAHGSALWLYYYTGFFLAAVGLILGLAGRDWIRGSSAVVSLVMVFQWYGRMVVGRKAEAIVTVVMFASLAVGGIIALLSKLCFRRRARSIKGSVN